VFGLTISMFFCFGEKRDLRAEHPVPIFGHPPRTQQVDSSLLAEIGIASAGEEGISNRKGQSASVGSGGELFRSSKILDRPLYILD
jgi:hypothetical protein